MNGTEKDFERSKEFFAKAELRKKVFSKDVERLREELGKFIVHQCPKGWTREQVELLTLRRLLLEAIYYADSEWDTIELHGRAEMKGKEK